MNMREIKTNAAPILEVLIIDDHKMIRDGLKVMLASLNKSIQFKISEAESGAEAFYKINHNFFELIIVDYQIPGMSGAEIVLRILRYQPETKIMALSNYDELSYIQSMIDAGAKGYVLKNIEPFEMLNAIRTILAGGNYYCNDVALKLIDAGKDKARKKEEITKILTSREIEVLQMISMEMTNEEIAQKLFVAKRTIDTHRQNLINKLQVKNTVGLVKIALQMDLVKGLKIR